MIAPDRPRGSRGQHSVQLGPFGKNLAIWSPSFLSSASRPVRRKEPGARLADVAVQRAAQPVAAPGANEKQDSRDLVHAFAFQSQVRATGAPAAGWNEKGTPWWN